MTTRMLLTGLKLFAIAAALAAALVLLGPVSAVRVLGAFALAAALAGIGALLVLLRGADPHAWMVLKFHAGRMGERVRAAAASARRTLRTHAP